MSGRSSQERGKRAEVEVVHALERAGYRAMTSRAIRGGTQHGADVISDFPAVLEVKDHAKLDLPGFWRQAVGQAGDDVAGLVVKRRGVARAEDWWYVSDVRTQLRLIEILRGRQTS